MYFYVVLIYHTLHVHILIVQERSLENMSPLPPSIACMFVRLVTCLLGEPIILDHLSYVCEHLLVSGINDVKYITPPGILDHHISAVPGMSEKKFLFPHASLPEVVGVVVVVVVVVFVVVVLLKETYLFFHLLGIYWHDTVEPQSFGTLEKQGCS